MEEKHVRVISIRYATPSRRAINIIVSQLHDDLGNWMVPTITFDGPLSPIIESGRYARDVAFGLIVAAYYYDLFMLNVKMDEQIRNDDHDGI